MSENLMKIASFVENRDVKILKIIALPLETMQ